MGGGGGGGLPHEEKNTSDIPFYIMFAAISRGIFQPPDKFCSILRELSNCGFNGTTRAEHNSQQKGSTHEGLRTKLEYTRFDVWRGHLLGPGEHIDYKTGVPFTFLTSWVLTQVSYTGICTYDSVSKNSHKNALSLLGLMCLCV